jgi:hypothetical protein
MTDRYKVFATRVLAQAQADALWEVYSTQARAERGLPPGASLDMRNGSVVEATTVRYCEIVEAAGETRAAIPVDDYTATLHGRNARGTVIDTANAVPPDSLPERLRDRTDPSEDRVATPRGRAR